MAVLWRALCACLIITALALVCPCWAQGAKWNICNIGGQWLGVNGDLFSIQQMDTRFNWYMLNHGRETANGTFDGRTITVSWTGDIHGSGTATGTVTCDAKGWATNIQWSNGAVFTRTGENKEAQGVIRSERTCNISGRWEGLNGDLFDITQNGNSYTWTMLNKGRESASGSIIGQKITVSWSGEVHGSGTAHGEVFCEHNRWATHIGWSNGAAFNRTGYSDGLGQVWDETESGWQGVWTRRGDSNVFDAVWTHPNGSTETAVLTISLATGDITVTRDSRGRFCHYRGVLRGNVIDGTYECDWARGPLVWQATIRKQQ